MKKSFFIGSLLVFLLMLTNTIETIAITTDEQQKEGYTFLRDASDISTIETTESTIEVPGKYNFSLQLINKSLNATDSRLIEGTSYKVVGSYQEKSYHPWGSGDNLAKASKVYSFDKQPVGTEQYVYVRQAGFYMGKSIDVKISLDTSNIDDNSLFRVFAPDYNERTKTAYQMWTISDDGNSLKESKIEDIFLTLGTNNFNPTVTSSTLGSSGQHSMGKQNRSYALQNEVSSSSKQADRIIYSYEFFETQPLKNGNEIVMGTTPLQITGLWNVDNVNALKLITDLNGFDDLTKYYIYKNPNDKDYLGAKNIKSNSNNILYKKDELGNFIFSGSHNAQVNSTNEGKAKIFGKISTAFTTLFENKTKLTYEASPRMLDTSNNTGSLMAIRYSRSAIPRVAPTEPYVIGVKNTATHTDTENYTDLQYDIRFGVGSNDKGKRNDALSIQTEVPEYYDIVADKITVVNMINDEKLTLGTHYTVEIDPSNKSKAKIIFTDPTTTDINDGYFRISINAETNSKFEFAPDKYGYLNDSTSEDNGYMHFDLAENTTLTYTHNESGTVNKTLTSKKIDERSIAKVNYEGIPLGESKDGLTLVQGNSIKDEYPEAASLLQDNFDKLVDTNNISRDTPVTASFIGTVPETKYLPIGSVVDVPIRLTTSLGVTKDIIAKLTIRSSKNTLNVEFRNEVGELLSSVQKEYLPGTVIDLTTNQTVVNELNKYIANGEYSIVERPVPERFTLTSTTGTKVYKLKGQVIISSAPELFDFGTQKAKIDPIEQKQAINLGSQAPLTIKDSRSNQSEGWTLYLRTSKDFTAEDGTTKLLGILQYRLDNTNSFTVSSDSEEVFKKPTGGDYNLSNDWSDDGAGLGIKIDVGDIEKLGTYKAEIEWVLMPNLTTKPVP